MFSTILIANRGEIALRIVRACRELNIRTVVVHSTVDRDSAAAALADESVQIGPAAPRLSYLNAAAIVEAALKSGADAIHPGYGFLSEDRDFAEICAENGISFIGPPVRVMERVADKAKARQAARETGLPVVPGSTSTSESAHRARALADEIGYPVIIKAAAGGGGRGMTVVRDRAGFLRAYARTRGDAQAVFGDSRVYVEKYLDSARHIEVQILADGHGNVVHLGARDCSVQRRRQKLIEETPPPGLPASLVEEMGLAAADSARRIGYCGAGTYEFLVDDTHRFYFMEINGRIQVEHPVTEMATGLDLVREQILVAAGEQLTLGQDAVAARGSAIECRINAEDPERGFSPTPGVISEFELPGGPFTRVDTHCRPGLAVTPHYDPLLAKAIAWAPTRDLAVTRMLCALDEFRVSGPGMSTTIPFLREVLRHPLFRDGKHDTSLVDQMFGE